MEKKPISLTVVMPALNEEAGIASAIDDVIAAFDKFGVCGEILAVNDGSCDHTPEIIASKMKQFPGVVNTINHSRPEGIGASFWDGVISAKSEAVCMLPADNENDPCEIMPYVRLLDGVDVIVPFVFNKEARSRVRNFLSSFYLKIINITFATSFNYTNGTIVYRKSILEGISRPNKGFFFQTDILIRVHRRGYLFAEVPYKLRSRAKGDSKAVSLRSLLNIIGGYLRLVWDIYVLGAGKGNIVSDSVTARRRQDR